MCFGCIDCVDIEITFKLSYLLYICQEAHKEYNSLMDKIRAKYEQLDSGEFGSPGTQTQHLMLKPVNWLIFFLMWANYA